MIKTRKKKSYLIYFSTLVIEKPFSFSWNRGAKTVRMAVLVQGQGSFSLESIFLRGYSKHEGNM